MEGEVISADGCGRYCIVDFAGTGCQVSRSVLLIASSISNLDTRAAKHGVGVRTGSVGSRSAIFLSPREGRCNRGVWYGVGS